MHQIILLIICQTASAASSQLYFSAWVFPLSINTDLKLSSLKRDIIFTGDVLNTTSRIQGLCNAYEVDLLISDPLMKKLRLNGSFQVKALGEKELKGKGERVGLYTLLPADKQTRSK